MVCYVRRFDNPLAAHAVCKHADPAHIWQGLVSVKHVVSVISMICGGGTLVIYYDQISVTSQNMASVSSSDIYSTYTY